MKQFVLDLEEQFQRPVTKIDGMVALIDTGALIPVISMEEKDLIDIFHAEKVLDNTKISGFGGECCGKVYSIDQLVVGELIFPNLHVFVPDESMNRFDIILSATMFHNLRQDIDYINKKMTVFIPEKEQNVRNLKIYDENGDLHLLLNDEVLSIDGIDFVNLDNYNLEYDERE